MPTKATAKRTTAAEPARNKLTGRAALIKILSKAKGDVPVKELTAKAAAAMEKAGTPLKGATPLATLAATVYVATKKEGDFAIKTERGKVRFNPDFKK